MGTATSKDALRWGETMQALEAAVLSKPDDNDLIRRYFDMAVSSQQLGKAKPVFEKLLQHYPNHHQARSLYVSLCLQLEDYSTAMMAIEILVAFSTPDDALLDAALSVREKIGIQTVPQDRHASGRLSVCMIVRNEQRYLASCLNSLKKVADEIVVVDTGSQDRSADIARIFGAKVSQFQWRDDFSAARNAGLDKAEGDWILILDADELIAEQDHSKLKKMLADHHGQETAFSMATRNYTHNANAVNWHPNDGSYPRHEGGIGWFPSSKIRLFPNNPEIRFQYSVHELVDPSVRSSGCTVKDCSIPIHHYGHLNETRNRKKAEAYFRIGYAKLEQLGDDVAAVRELAVQAGQLELWAESMVLWQRLLKIRPDFTEAFVNMSGANWQMGRYEEACDYAQRALDLQPESREACYNLAVSHLMIGRSKEAYGVLCGLLDKDPDYLAANFMAAVAAVCMGDFERGMSLFTEMKKSAVGAALFFGVKDLIKRLKACGRDGETYNMERALKMLFTDTTSHK